MGIKSDLISEFDDEIIHEFLDHYSIMMDSLDMLIVDLSKPEIRERSLNELFRVFYNIKSASGFLQIEQMHRLSMFVEGVLEELRGINKTVNDDTITWLLNIHDMFNSWSNDLRNDNELSRIKYFLLKIPDLEKCNQ
jgi:two-component system chemotaxis sensor kinase CheA